MSKIKAIKNPISERNKNVAKNRGEEWRKSLVQGKLDAQLNPSKLKILRVKMKVPQETIADRAKLTLTYYGMIERGTRKASKEHADKICAAVGKKISELFLKDGNKFVVIK